jgi:small-conductance mechanosensitive channel
VNILQVITQWFADHPGVAATLRAVVLLSAIYFTVSWLRGLLMRRLPDVPSKYRLQKALEAGGYVLGAMVFAGFLAAGSVDTALFLGLLTAGLAFTLQELILSVAGSLYIFSGGTYRPGDRIELNGIKGDVIDIDSVYTVLMEIGEWVGSDNYTGRIVRLSNANVFRSPVYNYSQDFPFVWDELILPIRYGSDVELAQEAIIEVAQQTLSEFVEESRGTWRNVVERYFIEDAKLEPSLATRLTDNWIEFNLRYIVSYRQRRMTQAALFSGIRRAIEATDGKVQLASETFEVVHIPTLTMARRDEAKPGDEVA